MKNLKKQSSGRFKFLLTESVLFAIRLYQNVFSPDHGAFAAVFGNSRCRFFPSCSEYTHEAIRQYGLFTGLVLSLKRILRCSPIHAGGYDPVR